MGDMCITPIQSLIMCCAYTFYVSVQVYCNEFHFQKDWNKDDHALASKIKKCANFF